MLLTNLHPRDDQADATLTSAEFDAWQRIPACEKLRLAAIVRDHAQQVLTNTELIRAALMQTTTVAMHYACRDLPRNRMSYLPDTQKG